MPKVEFEITPGHWIESSPEQLTDDSGTSVSDYIRMLSNCGESNWKAMVNGMACYLNANYCYPPRPIRVR